MANDIELDAEVIGAIKANRKIEAIKLLREKEGIGLKEAKQTVDQYLDKHPHLAAKPDSPTSYNGLLVLLFVAGLTYLVYEFFIKSQ